MAESFFIEHRVQIITDWDYRELITHLYAQDAMALDNLMARLGVEKREFANQIIEHRRREPAEFDMLADAIWRTEPRH